MTPEDLFTPPPNLPGPLREYVTRAGTEQGRRALAWVVGGLLVLGFFAFLAAGANTPADPELGAPSTTTTTLAPKPSRIPGFNELRFHVTPAPPLGAAARPLPPDAPAFCGPVAETPEQQSRGLMNRTDLAGYDAMVFRFANDTSGAFHMRNTRMPLTLAWFDREGRFLASVDMLPCPARTRRCPEYPPPAGVQYRYALEVPQGGLDRLGVRAGTMITLAGGC